MAIPHKDCATDASSNFSSDETKSGVQSRQTLFVWYCLIHVHTLCIVAYTQKISDRAGGVRAGSVYRETLHKLYAAAHRIYYTTFHLELLWFSRNSQKYFPVQEIVWVTVRDACGIAVPEKEAQFMRESEQKASLEKGGGTKCRRDFFVKPNIASKRFSTCTRSLSRGHAHIAP